MPFTGIFIILQTTKVVWEGIERLSFVLKGIKLDKANLCIYHNGFSLFCQYLSFYSIRYNFPETIRNNTIPHKFDIFLRSCSVILILQEKSCPQLNIIQPIPLHTICCGNILSPYFIEWKKLPPQGVFFIVRL